MQTKKEKGNSLEEYVKDKIKKYDPNARLTKASGASTEIGDVQNLIFYVECKNWDKKNIIMQMTDWDHLVNQLPIQSKKVPIYVFQNKDKKRFVIMNIEDFFREYKKE